jgi:hypothetical protein
MRKLYANFHIFYFQKRIVSAETIRGNTVAYFDPIKYIYKIKFIFFLPISYAPFKVDRKSIFHSFCS